MDATWGRLSAETRTRVLASAAAGMHVADYATAEAAYLWARDHYRSRWGVVFANIPDLGLLPSEFQKLRDARLLRSIGPPKHGPYCPDCHHRWDLHATAARDGDCTGCLADRRRGLLTRPVCTIPNEASDTSDSNG